MTSGQIVRADGKTLLSFGTAEVPVVFESFSYTDTYQIGVNLDTGRFDDIKGNIYSLVHFHELTEKQQCTLIKYVPVLRELSNNVMTISAKARSGKDHLATVVRSQLIGVSVTALGDAIRDVRDILFGKAKGKDRHALIMVGQGLRKEDPNIWIKVWLHRTSEIIHNAGKGKFICPDVRQTNEFTFFKSLGALTVKVTADEDKRLEKIRELDGEAALDKKLLNDETEMQISGFDADITIYNNYTNDYDKTILNEVVPVLAERGF